MLWQKHLRGSFWGMLSQIISRLVQNSYDFEGMGIVLCLVVERRSGTRKVLQKKTCSAHLLLGAGTVHAVGQIYNCNCFSIKLDHFLHLVPSSPWKHTYGFCLFKCKQTFTTYNSPCLYKLFGLTQLFHKVIHTTLLDEIYFLLQFVSLITIHSIEWSFGSLRNNAETNASVIARMLSCLLRPNNLFLWICFCRLRERGIQANSPSRLLPRCTVLDAKATWSSRG